MTKNLRIMPSHVAAHRNSLTDTPGECKLRYLTLGLALALSACGRGQQSDPATHSSGANARPMPAAATFAAPSDVLLPAAPVALSLQDRSRERAIPVLLYGGTQGRPRPLVVLSHSLGGKASDYGYLADDLVARGYVVASIQHLDRPGDPPMETSGDLATARRPYWRPDAEDIGFVIGELGRRSIADLRRRPLVLGHSNGGDITMLFATEHPDKVGVALSLDNRRMPIPRVRQPRICSVRSSSGDTGPGVLPSHDEQRALGMTIVAIPNAHPDMWDGSTVVQRRAVLDAIAQCIGRLPASGANTAADATAMIDQAGVLATGRQALESSLVEFERTTGHRLVVVTAKSLGGLPIETFADRMESRLDLNQATGDGDILMLVSPNDRQARIAVGDGARAMLPNAYLQELLNSKMIPAFRQGQIATGVGQAVDAIQYRLSGTSD